jgi:hypothetical protein
MAAADFAGRWNIYAMALWPRDAIDLLGPAHIEFDTSGRGSFGFIAVTGEIAWKLGRRGRSEALVFTWDGNDEMDEASGSGWVRLTKDGEMVGSIAFHAGDESSFKARRFDEQSPARATGGGRGRR